MLAADLDEVVAMLGTDLDAVAAMLATDIDVVVAMLATDLDAVVAMLSMASIMRWRAESAPIVMSVPQKSLSMEPTMPTMLR